MFIETISSESSDTDTIKFSVAETIGGQVGGGGLGGGPEGQGRKKRQAGQEGQQGGPPDGPPDGFGGGPGLNPGGNFQQGQQGEPEPPEVNEDFSRDADFLQLYMELTPDVRHVIGHRLTQAWTSL